MVFYRLIIAAALPKGCNPLKEDRGRDEKESRKEKSFPICFALIRYR